MDIKKLQDITGKERRVLGYQKMIVPIEECEWSNDGQCWLETEENYIKRLTKKEKEFKEFTCTKENISNLCMYLESGVEYEVYIKKATV